MGARENAMTKKEMSEAVLAAKKAKGLTWAKLAEQVGLGEVWLASCGHRNRSRARWTRLAEVLTTPRSATSRRSRKR